MANFDADYSLFYNLIYKDKDYKKEARFIYGLLKQHLKSAPQDVKGLDIACGTGRHIFELEKLGLKLDGSDLSASMIEVAKKTALDNGSSASFYNYSFQEGNKIGKKFDYVISMFSAIDYLTSNEDLNLTLGNINGLLNDNGLFVFDCWNGNAVTRDYSPVKVLKKSQDNIDIMRVSRTDLNLINQVATVKFNCTLFEDDKKKAEFDEVHEMRYFYFQEMQNFLNQNNFDIVEVRGFLSESNSLLDPYEWNITYVTRKRAKA